MIFNSVKLVLRYFLFPIVFSLKQILTHQTADQLRTQFFSEYQYLGRGVKVCQIALRLEAPWFKTNQLKICLIKGLQFKA